MKLIDSKVNISEIMLDIINPRLGKRFDNSQKELAEKLLDDRKAKELLTSMRTGLAWVNKITIVPIEEISPEEREFYGEELIANYKYIVVEGNTRVACLLHDSMKEIFDRDDDLPVVIVRRGENESYKEFLKERKRLQSIANIMSVKDWGEVKKAKQLFDSYMLNREIEPDETESAIFKELAETIGLASKDVKKSIYRYIFYNELTEKVEKIDEKDFKFFEVYEQNSKIRALFGWDTRNRTFIWDNADEAQDEIEDEETDKKQELLYMIPQIIEIAKDEKISSKDLRDIIRRHHEDGILEMHQKFEDIINYSEEDDYKNDAFEKFFPIVNNTISIEEKLNKDIDTVICILQNYPINNKFSYAYRDKIELIRDLTENLIIFMDTAK